MSAARHGVPWKGKRAVTQTEAPQSARIARPVHDQLRQKRPEHLAIHKCLRKAFLSCVVSVVMHAHEIPCGRPVHHHLHRADRLGERRQGISFRHIFNITQARCSLGAHDSDSS